MHEPVRSRFPPSGRATAQGEGEIGGLAFVDRIAALADDGGAILIAIGFLGLAFARNKEAEIQNRLYHASRKSTPTGSLRRG
jgi:hypothetical protein